MSLDVLKANRIAGSVTIEPNETIYDPVSKMRVSTPSNLIDTDFEYGLQSSKWETLELINNIPTFFSRDGSLSLNVSTMTAVSGSNTITVGCSEEHGLVVGNSLIVKGANLSFADGTYVVLTTPTPSTFTYRARRASSFTGSIREESTEIYLASLYQGTEFKLESLGAIATDGASPSVLTVTTNGPHGFSVGMTFILLNSLTSQQITFDSRLVSSLVYSESQAIIRTDEAITPNNEGQIDQAFITFGTAGVVDPGIVGMTLVVDGDATTSNLGIDEAVVRVMFPEAMPFKIFDETFDRIWVNTSAQVFFTNDTTLDGVGPFVVTGTITNPNSITTPRIDFLTSDQRLKKLYVSSTTTSMRIRWEGIEYGVGGTATTIIWELTFDCENDTIDARLIKGDYTINSLSGLNFRVIGRNNEASGATLTGAAFLDVQQAWKRQIFIRTTTSDATTASSNGYSATSLDLDNTSKFNPYTWTAEKFNFNPAGASRPHLYFALGQQAAQLWEFGKGINDTNYIISTRGNVLTFAQPHYLQDNRPYLYNPGILNGGLVIGGSQVTTPTVYYVRTKPGFYNGSTTTGTSTLNQTGSTTSFSIAGNTLTVNATVTGTAFDVGAYITDTSAFIPAGTYITARGTGTGAAGTYTINRPLTIPIIGGNTLSAERNIVTVASTANMVPGQIVRFVPGTAVTPFLSTHIQGPTVTVGHLTVGQQYTIAALGTTTQPQWNTMAGTSGQTYAVGSTFTAATNGAASGTGTANGSLAGILGNTSYYVKDVLSATQITITVGGVGNDADGPPAGFGSSSVNDDTGNLPITFTNPVAMGTATAATFTVQLGTIIKENSNANSTQAVLVAATNRRTALSVNFGVQAAAARFPLATDRFGPHSFMSVMRVHDYQIASGTNFIQCVDSTNAAIADNQPLTMWTTAVGGTTLTTNNWTPSQLSNIFYARNPNSDSHTAHSVLPFGQTHGSNTAPGNANFSSYSQNNGEVDGAIGTIAAAAQDATTLTLTFDEGNFTTVTTTNGSTNIITVQSTTGMKVGQMIQFDASVGNLNAGQIYYVLTVASGTTLTVSATRGGAAVALSTTTAQRVSCYAFGPFPAVLTDVANSFLGALNVTTVATGTSTGTNFVSLHTTQGLAINQPFSVASSMGGLVGGTTYYVRTIGYQVITLSATQGGAEFTITSNTSGLSNNFTAQPLRNTPKGHEITLRNNDPLYQAYEVSPFAEFPATSTPVRGIITAHTAATPRTLTIKLRNPLNNAVLIQTNNVGFDLLGSASASFLTFNTATTSGGSTTALTGATPDGYVLPINYSVPWSTGRSWYSKNHGFQNNDLVLWESSGGGHASGTVSVPTGMTNRAYFIVDSVTTDRFRLLSDAGAALAVTSAAGVNLDTTGVYADSTNYLASPTNTTRDTSYWNFKTGAVAAGGTAQTITFPSATWSVAGNVAGNVVVPTIAAGANTFTWTSAARPVGGNLLANMTHHGGLIKFFDTFNQPLKMGTPWGPNTVYTLNQKVFYGNNLYNVSVAGTTTTTAPSHTTGTVTEGTVDLTWIGDSRFNAYDIRVGSVTGTAPATSVVVYVLTPGGLPGTFSTTSTNKIVIDTGHAVRDEDNLAIGTSWMQDYEVFLHQKDNSYFPFVGAQIVDLFETAKIPSTTSKKGSITAVTPGADTSFTYTFPANTVNIASIRRDNNVATVTTATPHGFKEGSQVAIASVTDATFNNATAIILSSTYNTFTYANTGTNGAVSANGTTSQLIHALTPNVLNLTAATSNSTLTVTTAAHSVPVGAVVPIHFQGFAAAGSPWYALWDNKVYFAKSTAATTLEIYKDSVATEPLSTTGFAAYNVGTDVGRVWFLGAKLSFTGNNHYFTKKVGNVNGDTIFKSSHGLNAGTAVTYATGDGTAVEGLTGGSTKFVFEPTNDRFRLADTAAGWSTLAISFTQNLTNMVIATGVITTPTHGFTTGRQVQYLSTIPATGLTNGAFYYVRAVSATTCTLFWTLNGALNDIADDRVKFVGTPSGTGSLREALVVDITAEGTGTAHSLTTGVTTGAIDGLYTIANVAPGGDTGKFTLNNPTNALIPKRILGINPQVNVDLYWNAIYSAGHKLITGTPVVYTTSGTAFGPLVSGTTYYIIKVTEDWFRLADSVANASNPIVIPINLNSGNILGSGNHQFEAASVVGSIAGAGSIVLAAGTTKIIGNGTNFSTAFKAGDNFYWNYPAVYTSKTTTFVTSTFTSATHNMLTGMSIRWGSTVAAPTGLINNAIYYVRWIDANTFSLHSTYNDAVAGTNLIVATGGSGTHSVSLIEPGNTGVSTIYTVNSRTVLNLSDTIPINEQYKLPVTTVVTAASTTVTINFPMPCPFPVGSVIVLTGTGNTTLLDNIPITVLANTGNNSTTITATLQAVGTVATFPATIAAGTVHSIFCHGFPATNTYDVTSSLLLRADSSATHRPYDGGVELIATDSPNARVIRQTRKYFRYQSGKGIQVSFAINFSPSLAINTITGNGNGYATVTTRVPHRCTAGLSITVSGDTSGVFGNAYTIYDIVDDYTFRITLGSSFSAVSTGRPNFFVNSWSGATISCGLFDGQNGLFFEYDGSTLNVCRRNSTTQLGGTATVVFNSNVINGLQTQYNTELTAGDFIVIKGMSYKVVQVASNSQVYVQPSYRGISATNVVVSKTQELRIPQSQWNLDVCDGTGPTGYVLNKNKIQMAYIDYSWYGAGKVRFGFKTTDGIVRYVHQLVHNNLEVEAYLRSGNLPARYEVNTGDNPTFIPKLAHWGTSVIMDGGFDDDKAYLFSATSNQIRTTTGTNATISVTGAGTTAPLSTTVTANQLIIGRWYTVATQGTTTWTARGAGANTAGTTFVATSVAADAIAAGTGTAYALDNKWYAYNNGGKLIGEIGYAIDVPTHADAYFSIGANSSITGSGINAGTLTANPTNSTIGSQPYIRQIRIQAASNTLKNLLVINARPSSIVAVGQTYTVTQVVDLAKTIPLLSIRLAPSVDNGIPGLLGAREIINRMQLNLKALDVLSTHEVEVSLVLNADLDNLDWKRVTTPSLSQVVYHNIADTIDQGSTIFTFRVPPGSTNSTPANQRAQSLTTIDLSEITTMGNAIMGGNGVFPDGPDVLTLRLRYIGLVGDVSATSAFVTSCRLSWNESQA